MHVDLPALIQAYGYPLTFIGALFEGETIVTLAGLAVHRGHLHWPALLVLAAAGGSIGDTIYFALGRRYGSELLARWPSFTPAIERVQRLVHRNPASAVIAVRFLYGMRIAGPVVIGSSVLSWPRYLALNIIAAPGFAVLDAALAQVAKKLNSFRRPTARSEACDCARAAASRSFSTCRSSPSTARACCGSRN